MTKIGIILGSTRPGRNGEAVARWAFDLASDVWINVTPGPQPRMDLQAVYDPVSGGMILYGGDARLRSKFHDLWEMKIRPDAPVDDMIRDAGKHGKTPATPGHPETQDKPAKSEE